VDWRVRVTAEQKKNECLQHYMCLDQGTLAVRDASFYICPPSLVCRTHLQFDVIVVGGRGDGASTHFNVEPAIHGTQLLITICNSSKIITSSDIHHYPLCKISDTSTYFRSISSCFCLAFIVSSVMGTSSVLPFPVPSWLAVLLAVPPVFGRCVRSAL